MLQLELQDITETKYNLVLNSSLLRTTVIGRVHDAPAPGSHSSSGHLHKYAASFERSLSLLDRIKRIDTDESPRLFHV